MSQKKREQLKKEFRLEKEAQKVADRRAKKLADAMRPKGTTINYGGRQPAKMGRKFLGKTEGFNGKIEQRLEQAHLKAYLRGDTHFTHGRDNKNFPVYHRVQQELYYI